MAVTEQGFGLMAQVLIGLAQKYSGGRIAFLLEGGYDLEALRDSTAAVLAQLQAPHTSTVGALPTAASGIQPVIHRVLQVHEKYR
jgi:acetoin utilization deacetylase AcuC-like enzyme